MICINSGKMNKKLSIQMRLLWKNKTRISQITGKSMQICQNKNRKEKMRRLDKKKYSRDKSSCRRLRMKEWLEKMQRMFKNKKENTTTIIINKR